MLDVKALEYLFLKSQQIQLVTVLSTVKGFMMDYLKLYVYTHATGSFFAAVSCEPNYVNYGIITMDYYQCNYDLLFLRKQVNR